MIMLWPGIAVSIWNRKLIKMWNDYKSAVQVYNAKIIKIWNSFFKTEQEKQENIQSLLPLLHLEQRKSPIWFLGMNPSILKSADMSWKNDDKIENSLKKIKYDQLQAHKSHDYFVKLTEFYQSRNFLNRGQNEYPVFHDMYPVRHTSQKEFIKFIKSESASDLKSEFDLANKAFLMNGGAKIIIIFNAKASEYLKSIFGLSENLINTTDTVGDVTFIYSSMYTGQRALDRYARIRLAREALEVMKRCGLRSSIPS
jgi:hypothetical protein